jgi:hypothetical protein
LEKRHRTYKSSGMKLRHIAAVLCVASYLLFAAAAGTQGNATSDCGIRGTVGCPPVFGNPPAVDPTWPCGNVVDSETGKGMGKITCHSLGNDFSVALPPGKYTLHFEDEKEALEGVIVQAHKWTDVHAGPKDCPKPPHPPA